MSISDYVAGKILELINETDGEAEIQRNELAALLGCVPSQISYVVASRFTAEQGFFVQSRRGGGGYIRITRVSPENNRMSMHILSAIGERLDFSSARAILLNLTGQGVIPEQTAQIMLAAVSENALMPVPWKDREFLRASIFKNMLLRVEN